MEQFNAAFPNAAGGQLVHQPKQTHFSMDMLIQALILLCVGFVLAWPIGFLWVHLGTDTKTNNVPENQVENGHFRTQNPQNPQTLRKSAGSQPY